MKIPREIERALNDTGLPWKLEAGGKHIKVYLSGRMIQTIPRGARMVGSHLPNCIANIRRRAREITK